MKLAVVFPGIGYHCDKPLLYYARRLACEAGYEESIQVTYQHDGRNIRGDEEKMKEAFRHLYAQAEAVLENVEWAKYEDIVFISKSIGTIIAAAYAKEKGLEKVRHILYTPLAQTFQFAPQNAIGFIGTRDPWSDIEEIERLAKESGIPLCVYDGGNHSLENDDVMGNVEILRNVMGISKEFLSFINRKKL